MKKFTFLLVLALATVFVSCENETIESQVFNEENNNNDNNDNTEDDNTEGDEIVIGGND
ncbi:hypothetical protein [uncultured Aquimarina sp.]|uniref:hypothetical protein n=1 Tax=uncultured Aquimarina sp. TaxID=575652 RepID=UPI0026085B76|nr:hypothetical protein [uncultured Aquimarina sp.]